MAVEHVHLVTDLEILQTRAESLGHELSFRRGALGDVGSHADAVEAGPSGSFQECGQVAHGLFRNGVVVWFGLADHLAGLGMLGLRRAKRGLPIGELAGVAAEPQHAMRRQRLELANEAGVLQRKETRVVELLHFIGQAHEVGRHVRACCLGRKGERELGCRLALCAQAGGNRGSCGGGDKIAATDCSHNYSSELEPEYGSFPPLVSIGASRWVVAWRQPARFSPREKRVEDLSYCRQMWRRKGGAERWL